MKKNILLLFLLINGTFIYNKSFLKTISYDNYTYDNYTSDNLSQNGEIIYQNENNSFPSWDFMIDPDNYLDNVLQYKPFKSRLTYYFSNLLENFGNNQVGTCEYVAIGEVLTYFDTFFNDDIVPEAYDVISEANSTDEALENSPGSKFEILDDSTTKKYREELNRTKNNNLHSLLVHQNTSFGANAYDDQDIIKNFLSDNLKNSFIFLVLEANSSLSISEKNETLQNYARKLIQRGVPPIMSIAKVDGNGKMYDFHAVVAYDYDDNGELYMHTGWKISNNHLKLEQISDEGYDVMHTMSIIIPVLPHSHSNNYKIYYNNGEQFYYFCPCGTTIGHTHEFTYQKYDSAQHIQTCIHCHEVQYRNHIYLSERATCICGEKNYLDRPPIIIGPGILNKEEEVIS